MQNLSTVTHQLPHKMNSHTIFTILNLIVKLTRDKTEPPNDILEVSKTSSAGSFANSAQPYKSFFLDYKTASNKYYK